MNSGKEGSIDIAIVWATGLLSLWKHKKTMQTCVQELFCPREEGSPLQGCCVELPLRNINPPIFLSLTWTGLSTFKDKQNYGPGNTRHMCQNKKGEGM